MVASLLRGFARHRTVTGKPDDHWLPSEIYDEDLWDIDSVYLHIITDGSVGGPRPGRREKKSIDPGAVASCDVCSSQTPRNDSIFEEMKAHVSHAIFGTEETPAADGSSDDASDTRLSTWGALLAELPGDLSHLEEPLASFGLEEAAADLAASRPSFLARLKALGVVRLAERQVVANGLAKAQRADRIRISK